MARSNPLPDGVSYSSIPDGALGAVGLFEDRPSLTQDAALNSKRVRHGLLVRNTSGGTLAAGTGATFEATYWGTRVDSNSGNGTRTDGIVDPLLAAAVPNNYYFWLFTYGPCKVLSSGDASIAQGDFLISAASGEINEWTSEDVGFRVGHAMSAWASTNTLQYADLNIRALAY